MIILSGCRSYRPKLLIPLDESHWRVPSQAQQKDCFGNETRTLFRLTARLNDGHIVWRGWFDDRDDADAFLWALASGSLQYERELWRLPTPWWHPDLGEQLQYDFATVTFLTTPTGSNQTWTSPVDWNNSNNSIECIGGGGSGGGVTAGTRTATGGGAGAYSKIINFSVATPGTTTATYQIGSGGASVATSGAATNGNDGGDSWFNASTFASSSVGAKAGLKGSASTSSATLSGGSGGAKASGIGATKNSGGSGGSKTASSSGGIALGGGGSAGPNGDGNNGGDATTDASTNGGSADAGSGGAGGAASFSSTPASHGGNGTEWDASHGSGGGGGAARADSANTTAGAGGNYGGGGGGAASGSSGTSTSGAGIQGIIVATYTPASARMRSFGTVIF